MDIARGTREARMDFVSPWGESIRGALTKRLKDEMNAYNDMNLRRFNNPLCRIPIDQREQYFEEHKNELL